MTSNVCRQAARQMSTAAKSHSKKQPATYPFSKTALTPPLPPRASPLVILKAGKGIMEYVRKTLPAPDKQKMLHALFSRHSPTRLLPGSIVSVASEQAPTSFTGVLLAIRRRGPDTSFVVRNVVNRTGVEMQFFASSPHLKEIKVVQKPPKGRMRRAKLYYLRDSPEKMSQLASGKK